MLYLILTILASAVILLGSEKAKAFEELDVKITLPPWEKPSDKPVGYKWVGLKDGDPWTATLISKKGDVETWKGNDGCEWSWFGTFSPSLKWSSCTGADGKQEITPLKGKIWPVVVGNTFEYGYSGPTWMGTRKCTVKAQVRVKTGTGERDTFKILCKAKSFARTV